MRDADQIEVEQFLKRLGFAIELIEESGDRKHADLLAGTVSVFR